MHGDLKAVEPAHAAPAPVSELVAEHTLCWLQRVPRAAKGVVRTHVPFTTSLWLQMLPWDPMTMMRFVGHAGALECHILKLSLEGVRPPPFPASALCLTEN